MNSAAFFENFLPALFALLLAMDLLLAVSSRLLHCIRLVAFQGLIIGLIPLFPAGLGGRDVTAIAILPLILDLRLFIDLCVAI